MSGSNMEDPKAVRSTTMSGIAATIVFGPELLSHIPQKYLQVRTITTMTQLCGNCLLRGGSIDSNTPDDPLASCLRCKHEFCPACPRRFGNLALYIGLLVDEHPLWHAVEEVASGDPAKPTWCITWDSEESEAGSVQYKSEAQLFNTVLGLHPEAEHLHYRMAYAHWEKRLCGTCIQTHDVMKPLFTFALLNKCICGHNICTECPVLRVLKGIPTIEIPQYPEISRDILSKEVKITIRKQEYLLGRYNESYYYIDRRYTPGTTFWRRLRQFHQPPDLLCGKCLTSDAKTSKALVPFLYRNQAEWEYPSRCDKGHDLCESCPFKVSLPVQGRQGSIIAWHIYLPNTNSERAGWYAGLEEVSKDGGLYRVENTSDTLLYEQILADRK